MRHFVRLLFATLAASLMLMAVGGAVVAGFLEDGKAAAQLSQSELDALRAKLISLWNPPPAVTVINNPDRYIVTIRIRLSRDHRLVGQPEVLNSGEGPLFEATRDSAIQAVIQGQPYDMLSQATYDVWKDITLNFNPRDVFGSDAGAATAQTDQEMIWALGEVGQELQVCSVYFTVLSGCLEHQEPALSKTYLQGAQRLGPLALSSQQSAGVSGEAYLAFSDVLFKAMNKSMGWNCTNIAVLLNKYMNFCQQLSKDADPRLRAWIACIHAGQHGTCGGPGAPEVARRQNNSSLPNVSTLPARVPSSSSRTGISLKKVGGTFVVPVQINGAITLDFTVDSGAADVSVPADVFSTLTRTGTIRETDIIGEQTYVLADGSEAKSITFTIRSLKVGDRVVENVRGSVAPSRGSLLLGQSFLERFKSWSIDNTKHVLLLEPR